MESSVPEVLSSISYILLVMLVCMAPDSFSRISVSRVDSLWDFLMALGVCLGPGGFWFGWGVGVGGGGGVVVVVWWVWGLFSGTVPD